MSCEPSAKKVSFDRLLLSITSESYHGSLGIIVKVIEKKIDVVNVETIDGHVKQIKYGKNVSWLRIGHIAIVEYD